MKAVLVLEDGTWYSGEGFGVPGETTGEVVFNTCMMGYQEIMTDPSYAGQMVVMTYPLIGNYGFNNEDLESEKPKVEGVILKELCDFPSNWRCSITPQEYFKENNITGIQGIDTRALTKHLRNFGSMYGIISTECGNVDILLQKLKDETSERRNLVKEVTTKKPIYYKGTGFNISILDMGVKKSIICSLQRRNANITLLPFEASYEEVMATKPDGIVLSNGPGNPKDLTNIICTIEKLIGKKPLLGIGLGHQLLGMASGANVSKLKFGHHGGNHPVKDYTTGKCYITNQNHNFVLSDDFKNDAVVTHRSINDGTVEGFESKSDSLLSVQFYPEETSGLDDGSYIFDRFFEPVKKG